MILSTLAFGTVHSWSLAVFQAGAGITVILWAIDAWRTRVLRLSRNLLQLPVLGLFALGVVQLLPFGDAGAEGIATTTTITTAAAARTLSLDPYATRFALIQILSLFVYFAAALTFIDTPRRLRLVVRTLIIYGFLLAVLSMMQHFLDPSTILWIRQPKQAQPFGPFINRHHFAGYMELALALPLGLLLSGAVAMERATAVRLCRCADGDCAYPDQLARRHVESRRGDTFHLCDHRRRQPSATAARRWTRR